MRQRQCMMVIAMLLVWTALYLVALRSARGQAAVPEHVVQASVAVRASLSTIVRGHRPEAKMTAARDSSRGCP